MTESPAKLPVAVWCDVIMVVLLTMVAVMVAVMVVLNYDDDGIHREKAARHSSLMISHNE